MEPDAAERLLAKLRAVVAVELDAEERAFFACLVAPAGARLWKDENAEAHEVTGFSSRPALEWSPPALPPALRDALRKGLIRTDGFEL